MAYNLKGDALMVPGKILVTSINSTTKSGSGVAMSFPATAYGQSSAVETFTIKNRGDGPVEVTRLEDFDNVEGFEVKGLPAKFNLAGGQSLEFTAQLIPSDPAEYRWRSYGESVGGGPKRNGKKAREGLVPACMSDFSVGFEAERWQEASRIYRRTMGLALVRKSGKAVVAKGHGKAPAGVVWSARDLRVRLG